MSPNVAALVAKGVKRRKRPNTTRAAVNNKIYLWSNGQVPYEIDSVFGKCYIRLLNLAPGATFTRTFVVSHVTILVCTYSKFLWQ